jgi:DNA invertase Pin-like site-specific DNA recombinase
MKPTPTAYSYLRYSTPEQSTGDSVRRQTESSFAWCKRNGVTLDDTLKDEGVSAFKGRHRAADRADTHKLAGFLRAVEGGKVKPGSFLILESLDRLTREDIVAAMNLFTSLLMKGIKIVQLQPSECVYSDRADMTAVVLALVELSRGNSESRMKSERVGKAWANKLRNAGAKVVTRRVPGWIDHTGTGLRLNGPRAGIVRRIFALCIGGNSALAIAKLLNDEGVPTMGRATMKGRAVQWDATTVRHILTSRAAVGEYVPYATDGKRAAGEPVANYYPAVVDEGTYYRSQAALKTRAAVGRGRKGKHVNLFAGLLLDARSGGPMCYWHGNGTCRIVPSAAIQGARVKWTSFPAEQLEAAVLAKMKELTAKDVTDESTPAAKRLRDADARIAKCDALIAAWRAKMDDVRLIDTVATKLADLGDEKAAAVEEREAARREMANPAADTLDELNTLADVLRSDNSDEMRTKVRAAIRAVVESVTVLAAADGNPKLRRCAVRVQFRRGGHRDYLIVARAKHGPKPATWLALSFADAGLKADGLDLRNRDDAAALDRALQA